MTGIQYSQYVLPIAFALLAVAFRIEMDPPKKQPKSDNAYRKHCPPSSDRYYLRLSTYLGTNL